MKKALRFNAKGNSWEAVAPSVADEMNSCPFATKCLAWEMNQEQQAAQCVYCRRKFDDEEIKQIVKEGSQ